MAWIRLDDQIAHHPKFVTVGPVASWLWVCGQSYCARYLTDGFIPFGAIDGLGAFSPTDHILGREAALLVDVGLWDVVDGGWLVHDYLDYQPSKEDVEHRRDTRRANGRLGGRPAQHQLTEKPKQNLDANQNGTGTKPNGEAKTVAKLTPVPVPVPLVQEEKENLAVNGRVTDTPLPLDWYTRCQHGPKCQTAFLCAEQSKLDKARRRMAAN